MWISDRKSLKSAKAKGKVMYRDKHIRFYPDLSAEVPIEQRNFDRARQVLRNKGITRHRILFPARLLITHRERSHIFDTPAESMSFIDML